MYQLLIVDDEKEIREGLAAWKWHEIGIQVAGMCSHGMEALQFISEQPVDVVLTDIRMPFMDGLALIESLTRHYPFIKVVILSGHSDFDYAQKAIQYGASDYLLKPVGFADMERSMIRLVERLDEQKQREQRVELLARKANRLARTLRERFLTRLFENSLESESVEHESAEGEVLLEAQTYTAAVLRLDRLAVHRQEISGKERQLIRFSLDNLLEEIWVAKQYGYHLIEESSLDVYLLAKDSGEERFISLVEQLHRYLGLFKSTFSLAAGPTVSEPMLAGKSLDAAKQALEENGEECAFHAIHKPFAPASPLRPGAPSDAGPVVVQGGSTQPIGLKDNLVLLEAKRFIDVQYSRSLTMKEVAEQVFVSPGHLSALFKAANDTFLKYLTVVRMEKAKELLLDNSYKVYQIVEQVGYSDPAYFSEIFKKYTGKSPNEYRGKLKQQRDD